MLCIFTSGGTLTLNVTWDSKVRWESKGNDFK